MLYKKNESKNFSHKCEIFFWKIFSFQFWKERMDDKNEEIFVDTPKFGKEGNFVICFGSSGSGKSTMIKVSWIEIEKKI